MKHFFLRSLLQLKKFFFCYSKRMTLTHMLCFCIRTCWGWVRLLFMQINVNFKWLRRWKINIDKTTICIYVVFEVNDYSKTEFAWQSIYECDKISECHRIIYLKLKRKWSIETNSARTIFLRIQKKNFAFKWKEKSGRVNCGQWKMYSAEKNNVSFIYLWHRSENKKKWKNVLNWRGINSIRRISS